MKTVFLLFLGFLSFTSVLWADDLTESLVAKSGSIHFTRKHASSSGAQAPGGVFSTQETVSDLYEVDLMPDGTSLSGKVVALSKEVSKTTTHEKMECRSSDNSVPPKPEKVESLDITTVVDRNTLAEATSAVAMPLVLYRIDTTYYGRFTIPEVQTGSQTSRSSRLSTGGCLEKPAPVNYPSRVGNWTLPAIAVEFTGTLDATKPGMIVGSITEGDVTVTWNLRTN